MPVLHKDENIEIRKIVTGDYVNNAYLVVCPRTNQSVMIDAPAEPERVLEQAKDTNVQAVLFTHTHFDHIDGAQAIKDALGVPMIVHPDDESELPLKADQHLEDGGSYSFGNITLKTIHNPGHTPGATSLIWGNHLFSGDTLFPGGPGYTESPPRTSSSFSTTSTISSSTWATMSTSTRATATKASSARPSASTPASSPAPTPTTSTATSPGKINPSALPSP